MKTVLSFAIFVFAVMTLASFVAQAAEDFGGNSCSHVGYTCSDNKLASVSCAPAVLNDNVAVTDATLAALMTTQDFQSASAFKAQLATIKSISRADAKAVAYLKLAGIDSSNSEAVADFVGARSAKGAWITDLQRNADLTSAQAETVAAKLQSALRGNLQ